MRFCLIFLILTCAVPALAQQIDSLLQWSDQVMRHDPDSAQGLARRAADLASENQDLSRLVKARRMIAMTYDIRGELEETKRLLFELLNEHPDMEMSQQAAIFNSLGIAYMKGGSNDSATIYLFRSLELRSALGDSVEIASTYGNIGLLYSNSGDFEKSREYNERALDIKKRIGSPDRSVAVTYLNLGLAVGNLNQNDLEQKYYEKALELLIPLRDYMSISMIYNNIGWNFHHIYKQFDSATFYYTQALKARESLGDILGQAQSLTNLAELSVDFNRYGTAQRYLDESHRLALQSGSWREIYRVLNSNALLLEKIGRYQEALENYRLAVAYLDSVNNQATREMLADMETRYRTEQKERKIAEQNAEIQTQKASLAARQNQIFMLIGSLLVISLSGGIFYTRYRARQEARLQQAVIREKEKGIEAVFSATEEERKRISRDLHDGIGPQLNGVRLGLESLQEDSPTAEWKQKLSKLSENLQLSANEIRLISHQMMPKTLGELGLVPALEELMFRTFEFSKIKCSFSHHGLSQRLPQSIELSLYRIAQELINNVMRHADAERVSIQLYKIKSRIVMTLEDNGHGMNSEEPSSGHGLMNIRTRLAMINGHINYESAGDSGTLVTVSVPVDV